MQVVCQPMITPLSLRIWACTCGFVVSELFQGGRRRGECVKSMVWVCAGVLPANHNSRVLWDLGLHLRFVMRGEETGWVCQECGCVQPSSTRHSLQSSMASVHLGSLPNQGTPLTAPRPPPPLTSQGPPPPGPLTPQSPPFTPSPLPGTAHWAPCVSHPATSRRC